MAQQQRRWQQPQLPMKVEVRMTEQHSVLQCCSGRSQSRQERHVRQQPLQLLTLTPILQLPLVAHLQMGLLVATADSAGCITQWSSQRRAFGYIHRLASAVTTGLEDSSVLAGKDRASIAAAVLAQQQQKQQGAKAVRPRSNTAGVAAAAGPRASVAASSDRAALVAADS
jgi:hypothetical protein